jgi:hypothetical protein
MKIPFASLSSWKLSAKLMRYRPKRKSFPMSFRGDAKHRTRNLEIPGSRYRAPRNDELYPSNFSLETISMPKPESPL